jgi:hypothetical protein
MLLNVSCVLLRLDDIPLYPPRTNYAWRKRLTHQFRRHACPRSQAFRTNSGTIKYDLTGNREVSLSTKLWDGFPWGFGFSQGMRDAFPGAEAKE